MSSINGLGNGIDPALLQLLQPADDTIGGGAITQGDADTVGGTPTTGASQSATATPPSAPPLTGMQQSLLSTDTQSALIEIQSVSVTIATTGSADTDATTSTAGGNSTAGGGVTPFSSFRDVMAGLAKLLSQLTGSPPPSGAASPAPGSPSKSAADGGSGSAGGSGGSGSATEVSTQVTYNPDGTITTIVTNSDGTETVTTSGTPNPDQPGADNDLTL